MKKIFFKLLLVVFTLSSLLSYAPDPNRNRRVVLNQSQLLTETKAWLSVLPSKPNTLVINAVNNFIRTCKADGNWQLLDRVWLFAQDKQGNVIYSIVNPTSTTCTEVNSITWTQYIGYTGNASNMYVRLAAIPSTLTNFTQNNAAYGVYCLTNSTGNYAEMGTIDNASTFTSVLDLKWSNNLIYALANGGSYATTTPANTIGFFSARRTSSSSMSINKDGAQIGVNAASNSTGMSTKEFYLLATNNNGSASSFSSRTIPFAYVGSASINDTKLYNAVLTLKSQIGF